MKELVKIKIVCVSYSCDKGKIYIIDFRMSDNWHGVIYILAISVLQ